jgi:hypothetical protein
VLFQAVKRNIRRGGRRYTPYVFTQQGVAMLSSVLSTANAHRQHRDAAGNPGL